MPQDSILIPSRWNPNMSTRPRTGTPVHKARERWATGLLLDLSPFFCSLTFSPVLPSLPSFFLPIFGELGPETAVDKIDLSEREEQNLREFSSKVHEGTSFCLLDRREANPILPALSIWEMMLRYLLSPLHYSEDISFSNRELLLPLIEIIHQFLFPLPTNFLWEEKWGKE